MSSDVNVEGTTVEAQVENQAEAVLTLEQLREYRFDEPKMINMNVAGVDINFVTTPSLPLFRQLFNALTRALTPKYIADSERQSIYSGITRKANYIVNEAIYLKKVVDAYNGDSQIVDTKAQEAA